MMVRDGWEFQVAVLSLQNKFPLKKGKGNPFRNRCFPVCLFLIDIFSMEGIAFSRGTKA